MQNNVVSAPTIGLIINDLVGVYQFTLRSGISDVARERGANLICFTGGELDSPYGFERYANILYDLVSAHGVNGLVIASGTLGNRATPERLANFSKRYHPMPVATITVPVEDVFSIEIDNESGMREMITHMIDVHGYRRIAYLGGPTANVEAQRRYRVYCDVLAAHNIPLDENLIMIGDFRRDRSVEAINMLLERKTPFEAIVSANDDMALAALETLQSHGIRVPDQVAIGGFDDIEGSRFSTPPLTTVAQPLYDQGRRAAEVVLDQIAGNSSARQIFLPTHLILRQSCGCFSQKAADAGEKSAQPAANLEATLSDKRDEILDAILYANPLVDPDAMGRVLDALIKELQGEQPGALVAALTDVFHQMEVQGQEANSWQGGLFALFNYVRPHLANNQIATLQLEVLSLKAQSLLTTTIEKKSAALRIQADQRIYTLRDIRRALVACVDLDELMTAVANALPTLGINHFYVSLYDSPETPAKQSRLRLAYDRDQGGRLPLPDGGLRFNTDALLPEGFLKPNQQVELVAEALYFRQEQLGFVLFGAGIPEGIIYVELREVLSSAIKTALLIDEQRRVAEELRALDKMKSQFLANMSHELRTPLNSILNFTEFVSTGVFGEINAEQADILGKVIDSGEHLLSLINDLLDLTKIESGMMELFLEDLDLNSVIDNVISTAHSLVNNKPVELVVHCPQSLPQIRGDKRRIRQILLNLVSNAIKFTPAGSVTLTAQSEDHHICLSIRDTGVGIAPEEQELVFEPFRQTEAGLKQSMGTGLGLPISKHLAEAHGGKLWFESEKGAGSTFYITLPVEATTQKSE